MIQFLSRLLIRDRDNITDPAVRRAYGMLCGCVGVALNFRYCPKEDGRAMVSPKSGNL